MKVHQFSSIIPGKPRPNQNRCLLLQVGVPFFIVLQQIFLKTFFSSHEQELKIIHKGLYKSKKGDENMTAVLIQGGPESGKAHLAREYIWRHPSL